MCQLINLSKALITGELKSQEPIQEKFQVLKSAGSWLVRYFGVGSGLPSAAKLFLVVIPSQGFS